MGRNGKVSSEEKIVSIIAYLNVSLLQIANKYSLNVSSVKRWLRKYNVWEGRIGNFK